MTAWPAVAALFETVVAALRQSDPEVERVKLFGYDCLRSAGKVFAKVDKGRLIIKLPKPRIEALMLAGHLEPYDGKRGEMKLWVAVGAIDKQLVTDLASEAQAFVGG